MTTTGEYCMTDDTHLERHGIEARAGPWADVATARLGQQRRVSPRGRIERADLRASGGASARGGTMASRQCGRGSRGGERTAARG